MATRRRVLQAAAGVGAVALPILGQQHTHSGSEGTAAGGSSAYKAKWATAAEMRLLAQAADLIIPRTDTPGASDAKVHEYIDYALASDEARQKVMRDGLRWLGAVKGDRVAALQAASERPASVEGRFFKLLKDLTIDGYYQSKEGLVQELGWHGNTYLPEFKGCTHPEHKG